MVKKKEMKKTEKKISKNVVSAGGCGDKLCPIHGIKKLKIRGRVFEGKVVKKFPNRVVIQFERMKKIPKYERYEKRRTRLHARLPDCMKDEIQVGDLISVGETRAISKMIHAVVIGKVKSKTENKK